MKNSGYSLPGAMVILAIVTLVIFGFLKSQGYTVQVQNMIKSKRGVQDAKQAFEGELINAFRNNACFIPSTGLANVAIGTIGSMKYSDNVLNGVVTSKVVPGSMIGKLSEAKARCAKPRPPNTTPAIAANAHRYFCVEFTAGPSSPVGSFLSRGGSFAEVYIESRNFQTGQPVDCNVLNKASDGAWLLYSLYWQAATPEGVFWQSHSGAMNVSAQ